MFFWFLLILIATCLVYLTFVFRTYKDSLEDVQAHITNLEAKAEQMEQAVEQERAKNREVNELLRTCRDHESELKNEIALTSAQVKAAQKKETELEMDMYKKEFKRSKQRGY